MKFSRIENPLCLNMITQIIDEIVKCNENNKNSVIDNIESVLKYNIYICIYIIYK